MDYAKRLSRSLIVLSFLVILILCAIGVGIWELSSKTFRNDQLLHISVWAGCMILLSYIASILLTRNFLKPINLLADVIIYAGHSNRGGAPPQPEQLYFGREMVSALAMQVYDLVSMGEDSKALTERENSTGPTTNLTAFTFSNLIDLPLIGLDKNQQIVLINHSAEVYFRLIRAEVLNKPIYDVIKLNFHTDSTFESWLLNSQESALTASRTWERVRTVDINGNAIKQFDLVASFSKDNLSGIETTLCFFDRTNKYTHDDQEIGLVAMAVHELRTPLTIMRGYIEVFEDEVGPHLNEELRGFMLKMQASAEQLTAFVGNILNVARIEENQLDLKLKEDSWQDIMKAATDDLALRAGVNGKHIELDIDQSIPPVAVDRISIFEVINNLVDNAIKYSDKSDKIIIKSYVNSEGMIETNIQDFGIGIPSAVMPDLFSKFYRSHKSRVQISGTGLGLYLSKAIVSAHGGNIWVRSKENEGSTFTFTIQAYDDLRHEQRNGEDGIIRGAHGWIKNHSMNRQ